MSMGYSTRRPVRRGGVEKFDIVRSLLSGPLHAGLQS